MNKCIVFMPILVMVAQPSVLAAAEGRGASLRDIRGSLYCLANDPFQMLGPRNTKPISLIFSRDNFSWPNERNLWIFVLRGEGVYDAFLLEITGRRRRHYDIRNNATFRWDGRTVEDFEPLLGGVWTHNIMRKNFHKALKSKPISMRPFERIGERVDCDSYTSKVRFH